MESDAVIREQLLALLNGGNAHMGIDDAVVNFPILSMNVQPPNVPYTPWHLLEHIRITQRDILDFIRDPNYVSPNWPIGYWPVRDAQTDQAGWDETIRKIKSDLAALVEIVKDPKTEFTAAIPHAPGYNIFREVLLVADHNAYHIGEFGILREVMGTWPAHHKL
jgi:hypothetical protein